MSDFPERLISVLDECLPAARPVVLHEPQFGGREWDYVKECLDTGWVSSVGKFVDRFEKDLAAFVGTSHAVAVVNGTAALHIALKLAGVQANDEVLLPSLTFIATANAVTYCQAVPHFVEAEDKFLGIDMSKLQNYLSQSTKKVNGQLVNRRTNRVIRAIVPMHTFGHPVDIESLISLSKDFGIEIVEDAAEGLGSYYKGKHLGGFGKLGTLSFNGNKILTTGGGGAIVTDDPHLAKHAKHLTTTAKKAHPWEFFHDEVGYNYRLPNINAALGCAQLEQMPEFLQKKRKLAERYLTKLDSVEGLCFVKEPSHSKSNYWLNSVLLNESSREVRDQILEQTNARGLMTRPVWIPMHKLPMYKDCPRMDDLSITESIENRLINLPSSAKLADL